MPDRKLDRPERLLPQLGVASRREVARWVDAGRLAVGGRVLKGGERISPDMPLALDGKRLHLPRERAQRRVLVYHKPVGEVVTRHDPEGRSTVFAALPRLRGGRWVVVGRLDIATAGLLLFTTDGDLAARLMHPRHELERRYLARVHGELDGAMRKRLLDGVELEDGPARFLDCRPCGSSSGRNHWFEVALAEGRNREVRRLFEAVGLEVSRLKRIGFGPQTLPRDLRRGCWRELDEAAVVALDAVTGEHR
ncbi:MAG: rRNA pseudouridine synthase [Gammaproteobacteria bacterium]|nr:rRNA pseudouridine synthase [Gammaproteobacteria bacterium]